MSVPNFVELESAERGLLTSWFDWLSSQPLLPLPRMDEDPVRRQIDDVVTKALGVDADWVAQNPPGTGPRAVGHERAVLTRGVAEL